MALIKLGTVVHDDAKQPWVYVGCFVTTSGATEQHFMRAISNRHAAYWPWFYKATKPETLQRKFSDLKLGAA